MSPSLSVITVVYNDVEHIDATIQSVLDQTAADRIEYLVIDGGSTDGTAARIQRYEDQLGHWVSEPDRGLYDAMNKGVARSTGEYIGFINCGDEYLPRGMELLLDAAKQTDADAISGNMMFRHPDTGELCRKHYAEMHRLGRKCFTNQSCSLFHRRVYEEHGTFDLDFQVVADVDFFLRVSDQINIEFIKEDISVFDIGGVSSSCTFRRFPQAMAELWRLYTRHDLPKLRRILVNGTKFAGMSLVNAVASQRQVNDWVFRRYRAETRQFETTES